eukprot:196314-Pyramimonas_sp.AAC.1
MASPSRLLPGARGSMGAGGRGGEAAQTPDARICSFPSTPSGPDPSPMAGSASRVVFGRSRGPVRAPQ